ncbi:succinyl-diaminopimelate desuccinylase [Rubrimonas cliftonensis]|uniref:Succinyl-diaminopimelate desuccinylase n=1 Tax=Rubrimonas cliftonensis TaxID=89524 RepID=A0A1H3YA80_9RHOB|nr:succinyl-diaminopimelate desuccinylase [Rubrimonas cliftonensis]SEA08480.1 succinyldiaminopimelate desuccinylase [Rubrimonas cliftonensis]
MPEPIDPVALTSALIRCASVTPADDGAIDVVAAALSAAGFRTTRCDRGGIANLYARFGALGPVLGFNGHTDVVPVGDAAAWTHPPFGATVAGGELWGRGAVDMKSGVAAFVAAACAWAAGDPARGSLALLITGDEEGDSVDGTPAILDWMQANGERLDACIVGEPTSVETLGDMIKIGRRGSVTAQLAMRGVQGHTAYPHRARNPLPALARLLDRLASRPLDEGTAHFDPSTLAITTVDVGNPASNVIPAEGRATVNIRFNDMHDGAGLTAMLRAEAEAVAAEFGVTASVSTRISGEAFLTPPGPFTDRVAAAVARATNQTPKLSTTGGTSDARYVKDHCPVVEVGLVGRGMHAVDERVPVQDVRRLAEVYRAVIEDFFASS